jgi:hypothetical protein
MLKITFIFTLLALVTTFPSETIGVEVRDVGQFSMTVNTNIYLIKNSHSFALKGANCELRSLDAYGENMTIAAGATFDLALKNYNPAAATWTFIMRSFKQKIAYATIYCFDVSYNLDFKTIENEFNGALTINRFSENKKEDWISNVSRFLFWRPSLAKANKANRLSDEQKVAKINTARNHRSVIKFLKPYAPISEEIASPNNDNRCVVSTLYESHRPFKFDQVGEYKIVNLDYNSERQYLLIVARNFFKRPMYAIIHCHEVPETFTIRELTQDLDQSISVHKITRPHW